MSHRIEPASKFSSPAAYIAANSAPAPESDDADGLGPCRLWLGSTDRGGYGKASWGGSQISAHIISYEAEHGPIPLKPNGRRARQVHHICGRRSCVAIDHLELVTANQNLAESRRVKRLTAELEAANRRAEHWQNLYSAEAEDSREQRAEVARLQEAELMWKHERRDILEKLRADKVTFQSPNELGYETARDPSPRPSKRHRTRARGAPEKRLFADEGW